MRVDYNSGQWMSHAENDNFASVADGNGRIVALVPKTWDDAAQIGVTIAVIPQLISAVRMAQSDHHGRPHGPARCFLCEYYKAVLFMVPDSAVPLSQGAAVPTAGLLWTSLPQPPDGWRKRQ